MLFRSLLERLGLRFSCISPEIDETPQAGESAERLVKRLAEEKARRVALENKNAIVIGSDQVAVFDGNVIGKPGSHDTAVKQLTGFSNQTVEFLTAVSVLRLEPGFLEAHFDRTTVKFRPLKPDEIERNLRAEKPYDCAGAFKSEHLGITLFEQISSDDPTALTGLPLIQTSKLLRMAGYLLP